MPWYVPQRQRLPLSPRRMSSGVGFGCLSRKALQATTNPGVQKPHWEASLSTKACCTGCNLQFCIYASTVVIGIRWDSISSTETAEPALFSYSTVTANHSDRVHTCHS